MSEQLLLHDFAGSGNCYKVRLTAALVGIPLERRGYDILAGETRTPDFVTQVNANGRIPVLQVGDAFIPESNAACYFIADGSPLIPSERFARADMLRWMFFEQSSHEPNIATLRFWLRYVGLHGLSEAQRLQIGSKRAAGTAALKLMDEHLRLHKWLVGDSITIADVALFAYTHVADEADFDLELYPHVIKWMERIMSGPGYVAMNA